MNTNDQPELLNEDDNDDVITHRTVVAQPLLPRLDDLRPDAGHDGEDDDDDPVHVDVDTPVAEPHVVVTDCIGPLSHWRCLAEISINI